MPSPVNLRPMLGNPGVPQDDGGVRGVYYQEGDLLLMIPRDPHLKRLDGPADASEPLPIKRVGHLVAWTPPLAELLTGQRWWH